MRFLVSALCAVLTVLVAHGGQADTIAAVQKRLLFRSQIPDDPNCSVSVSDGTAVIAGDLGASAASSCPDAFAWIQFVEAIDGAFWTWATDQTMWPGETQDGVVINPPLPLCSATITSSCCDPSAAIDPAAPKVQCPFFRADYDPIPPLPSQTDASTALVDHRGLVNVDPGRFLRDNELELVFRNRAFFDYVYTQNLYSKEGLGARNLAQNAAMADGDVGAAQRLRVRFPVDAVMVKADFIRDDFMTDLGLISPIEGAVPNNPDTPYVVFENGTRETEGGATVPNYFYLVAMTNASKDIPIWHWYAMEHVANLGRCDYIGCRDSFGYTADFQRANINFGAHYIPPFVETDPNVSDALFVTGKAYPAWVTGEAITPGLASLFEEMGVGQGDAPTDLSTLHASDPAWMNYRLKGTQTDFTGADGVPTGQGASVTEGGFVNSASCTTCHSQASVDANGSSGMQGVGATWQSNLQGFGRVAMGSPDEAWFYDFGGPSFTATQVDFVWGILLAHCQKGPASGACDAYPDAP